MKEYEVEFQTRDTLGEIQVDRVFADSKAEAVMWVANTYNVYIFYAVRRVK